MKKIKVGLIGLGRISRNHLAAIDNNEEFELTSVCDSDPSVLEAFQGEYNKYHRLEDLVKSDIDTVSICTPSGCHAEHAIAALNSGKHVICEKPMAIKTEDALKMIQAANESSGELFIVKQNRFNDTVMKVSDLIQKNALGDIHFISCNVFWTRPQDYYDQAPWRGTWAQDGGAFMNQAVHYFDLVQLFGGNVKSVNSVTATLKRKIEAEDTGAAILQFANGGIGAINVTMLTYPKNLEGSITILGEKGTVKIGGVALNEILNWDVEGCEAPTDMGYKTDSVYGFGHERFYRNVVTWIASDSKNAITGIDGIKSLQIVEACYQSSKQNGAPVTLKQLF